MSQPYPSYADSGIKDLNRIPQHWRILSLKRVASLKGRLGWQGLRADDYTDEGPYLVSSEHFASDKVEWHRCNKVSWDRYRIAPEIQLRPNDLLMMKDGAAMGKLAFVDGLPMEACLNSHVLLFRPLNNEFLNRFLYFVLCTKFFQTFIEREKTGATFFGISQASIGRFPLVLPPLSEQRTIAAFLDRETGKIDALVDEQRRLIALLKEKRQAVISHAVTKGLDPTAPMKPSGIDWLGDIPAHWHVQRLRFMARLNPSRTEIIDRGRDQEVAFVPMEAVGERGELDLNRSRTIGEVETGYTYFREGDVVFAKITPCFENGKGAIMRGLQGAIGFGTTEFTVLRPRRGLSSEEYLFWLISSPVFRKRGEAVMYGAGGQKRVPDDFVRNFCIAFPPLPEQAAVAMFLDQETTKLDALTSEAETAINLLQERRSALISAAVTGKIDVRGLAPEMTEAA